MNEVVWMAAWAGCAGGFMLGMVVSAMLGANKDG